MKIIETKHFFKILVFAILLADFSIILEVPILRPILGFFLITFIPGFLIIRLIKITKIEPILLVLLSISLSIFFLMVLGFSVNFVSLSIGYLSPFTSVFFLLVFNCIIFVMLFFVSRASGENSIELNFNLTPTEKIYLITAIVLPILTILGTFLMNYQNDNRVLLALFLLVSILVISTQVVKKGLKRIYPILIFSISLSLVLLMSLRLSHLIGTDIHLEYYIFKTTLENQHWMPVWQSTLDSCLSISVLPTLYQITTGISPEILFKVLYSLLYSISPLVIYILVKRYFSEELAFLASCFFMFQSYFLITAFNPRTSIALLFFSLSMLILFIDKFTTFQKKFLFISFMISCVLSHYSTTYIYFIILLGAYLLLRLLPQHHHRDRLLNSKMLFIFMVAIFFWYSQVTTTTLDRGIDFILITFNKLNGMFTEELKTSMIKPLVGRELQYEWLSKLNLFFTWATFILISIGSLFMIYKNKEIFISKSESKSETPNLDYIRNKFEIDFLAVQIMCILLLISIVSLPYVSIGYDVWRTYSVALIILIIPFLLGAKMVSQYIRINQNWLIVLVIIPYFLFQSTVIYQLYGIHDSIILNSDGNQYSTLYVSNQDVDAANWLNTLSTKFKGIDSDHLGGYILISQGRIDKSRIIENKNIGNNTETNNTIVGQYVYLRSYNGKSDNFLWNGEPAPHDAVTHNLGPLNRIYDSNVKIYIK